MEDLNYFDKKLVRNYKIVKLSYHDGTVLYQVYYKIKGLFHKWQKWDRLYRSLENAKQRLVLLIDDELRSCPIKKEIVKFK
jgi:hypothetical protein